MNQNDWNWEHVRVWLLWLALPLVIGLLVASLVPQPVIGIIRLEDAIYSYSAQDMIKQIEYAGKHPEVRAVVLVIDSPGGTVVDTEAVYLELAKLRTKKPVVTVINGMAASGAYYLSVGTDYIYAKPSSLVGNIAEFFEGGVVPHDIAVLLLENGQDPARTAACPSRRHGHGPDGVKPGAVTTCRRVPRSRVGQKHRGRQLPSLGARAERLVRDG